MPTERTFADDWLKEKLHRDLVYRFLLVTFIAGAATYAAVAQRHIPPLKYFSQVTESIAPLVNAFGTIGLLLCILGIMFKDIEAIDPPSFGQSTKVGLLGGAVRRLAGDISLWTFGALTAVVTTATVAAAAASTTFLKAVSLLPPLLFPLGMLVGTGFVNILVRRREPSPWHKRWPTVRHAVFGYAVMLLLQLAVLLW
jgi:hypothetical protein